MTMPALIFERSDGARNALWVWVYECPNFVCGGAWRQDRSEHRQWERPEASDDAALEGDGIL